MSVNIIISTEYVQYVHICRWRNSVWENWREQIMIFLAYLILAYR